jgi:hypothetical protein
MPKKELAEALLPLLALAFHPCVEIETVTLAHIVTKEPWRVRTQLVNGWVTCTQSA